MKPLTIFQRRTTTKLGFIVISTPILLLYSFFFISNSRPDRLLLFLYKFCPSRHIFVASSMSAVLSSVHSTLTDELGILLNKCSIPHFEIMAFCFGTSSYRISPHLSYATSAFYVCFIQWSVFPLVIIC